MFKFCNFNTNKYPSCWVKLEQIPDIVKKTNRIYRCK